MTSPPKFSLSAKLGSFSGPEKAAAPQSSAPQSFDLFPTRIWQGRLDHLSAKFPQWTSTVEALRAASPEPAGRTNRGGWNSADLTLLDEDSFADLRDAVRAYCRHALKQTGLAEPEFELQSWANVHDRGGFNFLHMHDNCLLSGTFYLQVPEGSGDLVLRDPRPGVLNSFAKGSGANACKDIRLRPDAGLIVLFPHWLEHFVEVHGSDTPRISIAFNAVRPAKGPKTGAGCAG
jgi:uncharacterized protein (TIGR02466 family)